MECPKCIKKCKHCDGGGKVQDGDWWMCRHHKTGSELPYMWDAGMNAWWYAGHYMDISDVTPIYRMKEVE